MKQRMKPISVEKFRLKKGGEASSANNEESEDYRLEDEDNDEYQSQESNTPIKKKAAKRGGAAAKKGPAKDKKWEKAFTEDGTDVTQAEKKKRNPARKAREQINPNMIKTSNKLIGEIENAELYGEDDDMPCFTNNQANDNDTFNLTGQFDRQYNQGG